MTTSVIFYNNDGWLNKAVCFGTRGDAQFLPRNSVVVGFMKLQEDGSISELISEPYMTEEQRPSWEAALTILSFPTYSSA
jgi:hypothetical protein